MKLVAALSLTLVSSVVAGVALFGQARTAVLSPFPAWPLDGNIPDRLQNNYVFLGPGMGEVTVSYPASLEDPSQTGRKTFTYMLHNLVAPSFSVAISQDPSSGAYTYDYALGNGASAKQPIQTWSFVGPPSVIASGPGGTGWTVAQARPSQLGPPLGANIRFYSSYGHDILPGSSLDRFHVSSAYSPGFTTAVVRGASETLCCPSEVPSQVGDQIGALARSEWDGQVVVILGPRFPPEASVQGIAADFHIGISRLVRNRRLSGDSPFVQQALAALSGSVQSGGTPAPADIVKSLPKPSPGLESEIAAAMQVSPK